MEYILLRKKKEKEKKKPVYIYACVNSHYLTFILISFIHKEALGVRKAHPRERLVGLALCKPSKLQL